MSITTIYAVHARTEHGDTGTFGLAYTDLPAAAGMVERVETGEFGEFAETWITIRQECPSCGWDAADVIDDPEWHAEHCKAVKR